MKSGLQISYRSYFHATTPFTNKIMINRASNKKVLKNVRNKFFLLIIKRKPQSAPFSSWSFKNQSKRKQEIVKVVLGRFWTVSTERRTNEHFLSVNECGGGHWNWVCDNSVTMKS